MNDGSGWEMSSAQRLDIAHAAAINRGKTKPKQTRLGAKRVKQMEKLLSKCDTLDDDETTACRAFAARANYLALDRPDVAFATT